MELLGPSLENLFQKLNKKFSIKTSCMLGIQMIDRIEYIHSKKILHRDIKPDNFLIGRGNNSHIVYILDFGLSKKYWSSKRDEHIPFCTNKKLTGTARYASINALSGCEQGRRDDLESIGYIIMYFIRGNLPWQGLKINNKDDRYKKICDKKKATTAKELCDGYPKQLENFINYTRNLKFMEVPNYDYLRNLFTSVLSAERLGIDCYYDWDKETINYFRDFKSVYNKNDDKNSNNNYNHSESTANINIDINNNNKDKNPYIRFIHPANNNNTSYAKTQGNSNSVSMANNQGNKGSCLYGSNNNDISGIGQKQINQENLNGNEIIKDYIQDKNIGNPNPNIIDEKTELRNNLGNKENINGLNNNNNLEQQNLNQQNNFVENNAKENNNEQKKIGGMNPRPEKDNKCCSIF